MDTLFSLIIPTYNRAGFILKTVQSVLDQSFQNFEIVIVDDGSEDNTEEIIKAIQDPRIKYYKKQNEERAIARNLGIEKAIGNYITFLDSDDILYPTHFEDALKLIEKHGKPEWFHLAYEIKDENGYILRQENKRQGDINKKLVTGNHLSCIGIFVRKDIAIENKFNENREIIGSEDYELWLRLAAKFPLHYSNKITACMIQHSARSVTGFESSVLIKRIEKLVDMVISSEFLDALSLKKFVAHRYLYLSLHLAMQHDISLSIKYLFTAVFYYPRVVFSRKFGGVVKNWFK